MTDRRSPEISQRAFIAAADPSRYFPAATCEEARQRISRSIERGEGPVLLIGVAGTGKTMLLEVLAQQFEATRHIVPLAGAQLCTRRALLQMILFKLGLTYRGMEEGDLRLALHNFLQPQGEPVREILLLVDEAESLPGRLLEELRVLTNLAAQGQPLVSLVLAGNTALEERFAEPRMEAFSQRLASRCYLAPMGREETFQYIRAQLAAVGANPDQVFAPEGFEAVFAATDGVPRLVNQLGDQLMWLSHETGYLPLDAAIVQQAWSDLQQLPAPWNTQPVEPVSSVVEFGELDQSATIFDELDSELDQTDATEIDEDPDGDESLPASIPMKAIAEPLEDLEQLDELCAETFDATEELLTEISDVAHSVRSSTVPADQQGESNNPFEEQFEDEEVILDPYSKFESSLLGRAQLVSNHSDLSFSQQLQLCEFNQGSTSHRATTKNETLQVVEGPAPEERKEPEQCRSHHSPQCQEETSSRSAPANLDAPPTELLVIEESERPRAQVISGERFRQVFSHLESSLGESFLT